MTRWMLVFLSAVVVAVPAQAGIVQVDVRTMVTTCDAFGRCSESPQYHVGSGTIVAAGETYKPGKSLVLTAAHVVAGNNPAVSVLGNPARIVGKEFVEAPDGSPITDLAMLEVDHEFAKVSSLADQDGDLTGQKVWLVGWEDREDNNAVGISGVVKAPGIVRGAVTWGDSGGPVMVRGRVCGVIQGISKRDQLNTFFIPSNTIRRFVHRFRCDRYCYRERSVAVVEIAPLVPPPPRDDPPRPIITKPITPTPIDRGERGPQGEPGPIGPRGPQGEPGTPADPSEIAALRKAVSDLTDIAGGLKGELDSLRKRVNDIPRPVDSSVTIQQIQTEIARMNALRTPVQVMMSDGKVFSEDSVVLMRDKNNDGIGDPIIIRLVPKQPAAAR